MTIHDFLTRDHDRLDALFERLVADPEAIDPELWDEFRRGLLRHIAMEEKVLAPAARRARRGSPLPVAARLRSDHGAIAALLAPAPTAATLGTLRRILGPHNELEESRGGFYDSCDELLATEIEDVLSRLRAQPQVPLAPPVIDPHALEATRRALARAGYALVEG